MTNQSQTFRLLDLPLELREEIYGQFLQNHSALGHGKPFESSFLRANKTVFTEMNDVFSRHQIFTYRISAQHDGFDGLSKACLKKLGEKVDYGNMRHLIVEIFPPPPWSVTDTIAIIRRIEQFCNIIQPLALLRHLSIRFLEDGAATWSTYDEPTALLPTYHKDFHEISDVEHCLERFATLRNIREATVELPAPWR